jgi:hypothetical protein
VTIESDPLGKDYLRRLRKAARNLSREQRQELLDDIKTHIDLATATASTETEVREVLESVGSPEVVAASAGASVGETARSFRDVATILLLLIGGVVVPVIGWLVGVALLWSSGSWTTGRKLLATLVWPGGLGLAFYLLAFPTSSSSSSGSVTCSSPGTATVGPVSTAIGRCVSTSGSSSGGLPTWLAVALFVAAVVLPVCVAIDLYLQAGRRRGQGPIPSGGLAVRL